MPDLESIGDAATGGLIARAVEPAAGEGQDAETAGTCLNCGCALTGPYCHCCGQKAHVHRTVGAFWHDLLHGVLHFEGKIWRTLPKLALHPGELTRRYIAGERANFVSPLALFLFSVFLMFAVFSITGSSFDATPNTPAEDRAEAVDDLAKVKARADRDLGRLQDELNKARAAGQPTALIEAEMAEIRADLAIEVRAYEFVTRLANEEEKQSEAANGGTVIAAGTTPGGGQGKLTISRSGIPIIDRAIERAEANPSLLLYKLQANAYKFSWLLIPISLPFVWLLFLHRRRYRERYGAYDHLIFITYSIAFMSLGAILLAVVGPFLPSLVSVLAVAIIPPVHMYRQLRGAYELSHWSAVWRTAVLLLFTSIALGLFMLLLLVLGIF